MSADAGWGWCPSCQCLYSFDSPSRWSCATGGRHNRNANPDAPRARCGEFRLEARQEGKTVLLGGSALRGDDDDQALQVAAHWPLAADTEERLGIATVVEGNVMPIVDGASANEGMRFAGGSLIAPTVLENCAAFTVTWWMQAEPSQAGNAGLFDYPGGFVVLLNQGSLALQLETVENQALFLTHEPLPKSRGRWIMCAITVGRSVTFFVDGQPFGESQPVPSSGPALGPASLRIGAHRDGNSFTGALTDVRVYRQELVPGTIADKFDEGAWRVKAEAPTYIRSTANENGRDSNWHKCLSCGLLVRDGQEDADRASSRRCPADRSGHRVDWATTYSLSVHRGETPADQQSGWTRCHKCSALYFAPFTAQSWCTTGGRHESDGSSYLLPTEADRVPQFAEIDTRGGSSSVLFLGANEEFHTPIALNNELGFIEEAIADFEIDLRGRLNTPKDELAEEIEQNGPRIVHISAHGIDARAAAGLVPDDGADWDVGGIWLLGSDGEPGLVSGPELAELFAQATNVHGQPIVQVVILNVCRSAPKAELIAEHVPFVVAVDGDIPDRVAQIFSPMFYSAFGAATGTTVHRAAVALAAAERLLSDYFPPDEIPRRVEPPAPPSEEPTP